MKEIHIVTQGYYDDISIAGIFTTEELAKEFILSNRRASIYDDKLNYAGKYVLYESKEEFGAKENKTNYITRFFINHKDFTNITLTFLDNNVNLEIKEAVDFKLDIEKGHNYASGYIIRSEKYDRKVLEKIILGKMYIHAF